MIHQMSYEGDTAHTFLDAIDDTREGVYTRLTESLLEGPTTSVVSFIDCEEADSPQNSQQSLVKSFQNTQSDFDKSRRERPRAKSQLSSQLVSDSYQLRGLKLERKAKTKSFIFSITNKSTTKPSST